MRFFFEIWAILLVCVMAQLGCLCIAILLTGNTAWSWLSLPLILWVELLAIARIPDVDGRAA